MVSRRISRAGSRKVARTQSTSVREVLSHLPDLLVRAAREKNLIIFAGAGVSMLPPSALPDWRQFNEILLDEVKSQALAAEVLDENGKAAIASLKLEDVGVTTFSEAIVKIATGEGYFPVLQVLDSALTNANHKAMADLGRQGILRAIVTTNFDTLIERAFAEAGVPLQVAVTEEAFLHPSENGVCTLFKIHGSVTDATTLVDTVGQKLRGLPPFVRSCLAAHFTTHHVLVVGYSGFDLEFGSDYLSFSSVNPTGPGLTWGVRVGTQPSERIVEIMGRAGERAAFYEAKLPDIFHNLGAQKLPHGETSESEGRRLATERTRPHIASLFAVLGGRNALALCMRLLADAGRTDEAALVHATLAADIESQGVQLSDNDGPAIRAMAATASLFGNANSAGMWTRLEVQHLERRLRDWLRISKEAAESIASGPGRNLAKQALPYPFRGNFTSIGWRHLDYQVRTDFERLQAGAWTNLANDFIEQREIDEAGKALKRSLDFCELSGDLVSLAAMFTAFAGWTRFAFRDPDQTFAWTSIAEATSLFAGNVDAANSAALLRAEASLLHGEYDTALSAMDRVKRRATFGLSQEMFVDTARLLGIIELRRGNPRSALATWRHALAEVPKSVALTARIRWTIITSLSYDPAFGDELIEECERLLAAIRGDKLTKRLASIPSLDEVEQARRDIAKKVGRMPDFFEPWPEVEGDPMLGRLNELWQALVHAEAVGDKASVILCLRSLCMQLYEVGKFERAREVALAFLAAAERADDFLEQLAAKWLLGNASFALGDNSAARDIFEFLNGIEFAADPKGNERIMARLAALDRDPPRRHLSLELIEKIEDRETRPRSADEGERLARLALQSKEFAVMRIVTFEVLSLRRRDNDEEGMARCYDILADAAKVEGRDTQMRSLQSRARELRVSTVRQPTIPFKQRVKSLLKLTRLRP